MACPQPQKEHRPGRRHADRPHQQRRDRHGGKQAYDAALPKAVDDGREDAHELAAATGLTLSDLLTVSNAPNAPYFGPFGGPVFGSFGRGRFCGTVRRAIFKRTKSGPP